MNARKLVAEIKTITKDTSWKDSELPPRHSGIFAKSLPMGKGWIWRSLYLKGDVNEFLLLFRCNSHKDDRMAWLMVKKADGYSMVSRFENHGSHPGLHVHSRCSDIGLIIGSEGIDDGRRIPTGGTFHRRQYNWTNETFYEASIARFNVITNDGQTSLKL